MKPNRPAPWLALIFAPLAGLPLPALAQNDVGPYLTGSLGVDLQDSKSISESTKGTAGSAGSSAQFGTGFTGSITPGFAFGENIRTDLELSYRSKPGKGDGIDENAYSALANLWVDVLHQNGYFIYFGGGLGAADVNLNSNNGSDSSIPLLWQLGTGAGVVLTSNWALSADFRHIAAFEKSTFDLDKGEALETRYGTNAVTVGLRYSFGGMSAPLLGHSEE